MAISLKVQIDLPLWQWLRPLPVTSAAGASSCTDKRGTQRYIYHLLGASSFWRYDTWTDSWQQLANPPTLTFAAGVSLLFDPSRGSAGYVWLFAPLNASPWCVFAYYDIATNTWTPRAVPTGLTAQWGTDASLAHTCSAYHSQGNDDQIYLIGNNATTWYRYSISDNSWTVMSPALPATAGAGCWIAWIFGFNPDRLYYIRGGATTEIYYFTISTATWSPALDYVPRMETFSTGSCYTHDAADKICLQKDNTHRLYRLDLTNLTLEPASTAPYIGGTAIVGDGLDFIKTTEGLKFLYFRRHTGVEYFRTQLWW